MTFPLTATAFDLDRFVGLTDRGSTKVKNCVDEKGGRTSFSNSKDPRVEFRIALSDGDGLDGDDLFVASFYYFDAPDPETELSRGVWSKIDERKNGRETYQLTPSGDLTEDAAPGWEELLTLMSDEVENACLNAPPAQVYEALSDLVKGTLVVENKQPKCATTPENKKAYNKACYEVCRVRSCMKAKVLLDVKAFMNDDTTDTAAEVKTDWVRFRYKATGYVVGSNPP
jgi:hypothetical protein